MTTHDHAPALSSGPLNRVLGTSAWTRLRDQMHERTYAAGEVLVRQGEISPDFFLVLEGAAIVTAAAPNQSRMELGRVIPGECLGEMSLLTGEPASAEVMSTTATKVLAISQKELSLLGDVRSELFEALSAILATRLKLANQRLVARPTGNVYVVCCPPDLQPALLELPAAVSATTSSPVSFMLVGSSNTELLDRFRSRTPDVRVVADDPSAVSRAVASSGQDVFVICEPSGLQSLADSATSTYFVAGGHARPEPARHAGAKLILVDHAAWTLPNIRSFSASTGQQVSALIPPQSPTFGAPRRPIDRLARTITDRTIGVAFGAGAAKGLAHLGVLRALDDLDVPIDMVSGSSIGSAVAACVASGMPVDEFGEIVTRVAKRAIRPTLPVHSFLSNAAIKQELRHIVGHQRIEDLNIPLSIVAVDIYRRAAISFTSGLLWPRIAASMAIPGVYPASAGMGSYLVDGGVLSPVPVGQCRELGAGIVIGVRLTATKTSPRDDLDFVPKKPFAVEAFIRSFDIMLNRISEMSREPADISVEVCIEGTGGIRDFERVGEIADQGYASTLTSAQDLRERLPYLKAHAS